MTKLTQRLFRRVHLLQRNGLERALVQGMRCVQRLSPAVAVNVREKTRLSAPMDYEKHAIHLEIESSLEYEVRLNSCRKEPETVAWIEQNLRGGDVLFDVGANVGAYSLVAAKHGSGARVFAFEPAFANFAQLCRNVVLNRCEDTVIPMPLALSSATGVQMFHYSGLEGFAAGAALHSVGTAVDEHGRPFTPAGRHAVLSYRLDDLLDDLQVPGPTLLKLDTDGHELAVLEGAERTLGNARLRSILVELHDAPTDARRAAALLRGCGFEERSRHSAGHGTYNVIFDRAQ